MRQGDPPKPRQFDALWRNVVRIVTVIALGFVAQAALGWLEARTAHMPGGRSLMLGGLVILLAVYAGLIAIPFVPGVELGVALMVMQGAKIAPFVYGATLCGLMLAYMIGARVPEARIARALRDIRLARAAGFVQSLEPLSPASRLGLIRQRLPGRLAQSLIRYRYLAIAVAVNMPGNSLIGGGGGISMLAGLSRLFSPGAVLITLALATLPVPLAVMIWGPGFFAD